MRDRKAQIQGQIFIFILALIIFSAVLIYGYNAIKRFNKQSEDLMVTQLISGINTQIERVESQYGSVINLSLDVPEKYEEICFIDTRQSCGFRPQIPDLCTATGYEVAGYPIICDSWKDCTGENFFLVGKDSVQGFDVGVLAIKAQPNGERFFCQEKGTQKTSFRLKGMGEFAEISQW